ncbi:MAG: hypothetical protein R6X17_10185 [Candidatus Competibacteraceae bacterium]
MARFQALTNAVLDAELDLLRARLGLKPNQKADLLREMATLAGWIASQAEQGRTIEARRDGEGEVEPLVHPALERLRTASERPVGARLTLSDAEARRLAAVFDGGFDPPPALRAALANLARAKRQPPPLRWPPAV